MPDAVWQGMKPSIRNRYAILQQTDKTPEELQKELYADVTKTMSPEQLKDLNTIQQTIRTNQFDDFSVVSSFYEI